MYKDVGNYGFQRPFIRGVGRNNHIILIINIDKNTRYSVSCICDKKDGGEPFFYHKEQAHFPKGNLAWANVLSWRKSMKIIKRSGSEAIFDINKIIAAVRKANDSVID